MADGILTSDDGAVSEAGGDVVGEIADDGGEDCGFEFVYAAYYSEKINR